MILRALLYIGCLSMTGCAALPSHFTVFADRQTIVTVGDGKTVNSNRVGVSATYDLTKQ